MISRIIQGSLNHRGMVLFLALVLAIIGVISIQKTPIDAIPDLSDVQVIIKTSYAGQAPDVVENQVTYPLTSAMLAVPKSTTVRGYSFFGDSYVYILFEDGTDPYWARSRVLEYLNQVSALLPKEAKAELGPDATGVGWVYQYALVDHTGQHDISDLTSVQNWFLKFELQNIGGVAEVATIGGMVKQYQVVIDPLKLHQFNLTFAEVRQAIQGGNMEVGGSVIEMAEAEYMVRVRGYVQNLDDIRNIPIRTGKEGTPLLVQNVATVSLGPQMRRGVTDLNGEGEAVGGIIITRFGENALNVIDAVKAKLEILKKSLPKGVEVVEVYDRSSLINRAVNNLSHKLIEEFIVVSIICILFLLHLTSSLVIALTLPLGILSAYIIMNLQGINANIMSLGGIAIAIGAMVDAAIVMIESLHKKIETTPITPENRWQLISEATRDVGPILFYSLLIITVSFMPVFALEAQEGRLFKPLAFTKTYAMASAAILSITLVPVLMGYLIRGHVRPEHKNPLNRMFQALYKPILSLTLKFPKMALSLCLAIALSAVYPAQRLGSEFMPPLAEGDFLYMPSSFPAISVGKVRQLLQQSDRMIMTVPEVLSTYGKAGRANTATDPAPLTMIETTVRLKPRDQWRDGMTLEKIRDELDQAVNIPGLTNAWVYPIKGRIDMLATGIKTPVGLKISGPDLGTISDLGQKLEKILKKVPGTASVYSERVVGGRYIDIEVDRLAAARFGMNISDVQDIIRSAVGGMNISETIEGRERYPINLRFPRDERDSPERLKNIPVVTKAGAHVRLGDITHIRVIDGPGMIRSENARLNGWVYVDTKDGDIGSYIARAQNAVDSQMTLPAGYSLRWSGQFEYMERAKERLKLIVPFTLMLIIFILYLAFRRVLDVALILISLPLALSGGLWLLFLLDFHLSIAVSIGFIALGGVAIELSMVMFLFLNNALRQERDKNVTLNHDHVKNAIMEGAGQRLRPLLMTVITIIAGLLPIMLGDGTGSEVMKPIATPMVGGMISASILTLIALPALFYLWHGKDIKD
ncbi:MAG: CusA/CzcA family heavy metal efflux RND transporter [Emcibacter sp.]|nr:CusA/CzcA family heavy metal efflux RND transporter [Emcibacter sp.]